MLNPHEAHNDRNDVGHDMPHRDAAGDRPTADRPIADREVPLPGLAASEDPSVLAIHQWLDGELSEADARRADAKRVAMWSRIAVETDQRRRMATPTHVAANIMAALPAVETRTVAATATVTATATATAANVEQASGVSVAMVAVIGTVLFAAGAMIGKLFL